MSIPKRKRGVPLFVWVSQDEYDTNQRHMEEARTQNIPFRGLVIKCPISMGAKKNTRPFGLVFYRFGGDKRG